MVRVVPAECQYLPLAMAHSNNSPELFANLKFWVSQQVPDRSQFLKKLRDHGGNIAVLETKADYCLIDPERRGTFSKPNGYSYKFVLDSIDQNELQDGQDYQIAIVAHSDRPVGDPTIGPKTTRTPFTSKDDQLLYNWVKPFADHGGKFAGNELYKQIARKYPHHPYQSWRDRWVKFVQFRRDMTITENVDAFDELNDATDTIERSPKRRKVNETPNTDDNHARKNIYDFPASPPKQPKPAQPSSQPILVNIPKLSGRRKPEAEYRASDEDFTALVPTAEPANGPRTPLQQIQAQPVVDPAGAPNAMVDEQNGLAEHDVEVNPRSATHEEMLSRAFTRKEAGKCVFTQDEERRLYTAVPHVCNTNPTRIRSCWQNVAANWKEHTADEWQGHFEDAILPEYMRRHRLETESELEEHIHHVLAGELDPNTPDIKEEPEFEIRTPELNPTTPGIRQEPEHDGRTPEQKQRDRELERTTAELDSFPISDVSNAQSVEESGFFVSNVSDQGEEDVIDRDVPGDPVASTIKAVPPSDSAALEASRSAPAANEGRKRASQNSNSTQSGSNPSQSTSGPSQSTSTPSQDMEQSMLPPQSKLFGRTLELSQAATRPSLQETQSTASMGVSSSIEQPSASVPASTDAVTSSSSLPTAQKPPQSFQVPPNSASTSQESAAYQTVQQAALDTRIEPERTADAQQGQSEDQRIGPVIDLLGDGEPEEDVRSQDALSDTGSEYMAFDTAPERSQLWETASNEAEAEGETDEDQQNSIAETSLPMTQRRPPTPVRPRAVSEETIDEDGGETVESGLDILELVDEAPTISKDVPRLETQALFKQQVEEEVSEFSLPLPDGGWEALGLENLQDEDPETAFESIELPDDHPSQRRISPAETINSSEGPEDIQQSPVVVPAPSEVHHISSDNGETEEDEDEQYIAEVPARRQQATGKAAARMRLTTAGASTTSPLVLSSSRKRRRRSSSQGSTTSLTDATAVREWYAAQLKRYTHVPLAIRKRLASTALHATCQNVPASALLLPQLVDAYQEMERRRQDDSKRRRKKYKPRKELDPLAVKAFLPKDVTGVWTPADDNALLSSTSASIRQMEAKHTKKGVQRRKHFVQKRYGFDDEAEDSSAH